MSDLDFMRRAIELSRQAVEHGNEPFGAVLVKDGVCVMEGENQIYTAHDPTFHAELGLIRRFCAENRIADLSEYTLYSSCEPCFMCSGGLVWAKLGRLVYGASDRDYCGIRGFVPNDCSSLIFRESPRAPRVEAGLLRGEAVAVLQAYFGASGN